MKKLFSLSSKQWISGLTQSAFLDNGGIFVSAKGVHPFLDPNSGSVTTGALVSSAAPVAFGAAYVDNQWAGVDDGTGTYLYTIGDSGHFYKHNLNSDGDVTDLRSATPITTPAAGIGIFQAKGEASRNLYYFQTTQIGKWDLSGTYATGWTDNWKTGLQSTTIHPTHEFAGTLWYGNKDRIGKIYDTGSNTTDNNSNVLQFPPEYTVTSLSDDGTYLIIGLTKNTISGNTLFNTDCKIVFWNLESTQSWIKEYKLKDSFVGSIKRVGNINYVIGAYGIYAFDFSTPPQRVLSLATGDTLPLTGGVSPTHYLACVRDELLVWASSTAVNTYGKTIPQVPKAYHQPFTASGTIYSIFAPTKFKIFVGGKYVNYATQGGTATAKTFYVSFGQKYHVQRINVSFAKPLATGDAITIKTQTGENASAATFGSQISYTTDGAIDFISRFGSVSTDHLSLTISFDGGSPQIRSIDVYGEPEII